MNRESKYTSTRWAHSVSHRRPVPGAEWRQQLGASLNISSPAMPPRGSRYSPMQGTELSTSTTSSSAWSSAAHSRGAKPTEAVWRTGFELLLLEHSLGPTERPAAWVMKWARDTAPVDVFHARSFEWAFGRLVYATSALELHRPFLAPQCSFTSSSLADAVRAVLACVAFFRRFKSAVTTREEEWEP